MRSHRYRRSYVRRQHSAMSDQGPGLVDELIDLTVALLGMLWRISVRFMRWVWRSMFVRPAVRFPTAPVLPPSAPLPPYRRRNFFRRSRLERIEETTQRWREREAMRETRAVEQLPYRPCRVISEGEWALWAPLTKAVQGRYRLFCKVRL